ncbi:hypothetical protein NGF19_13975 [Streptomyces sp. RY43-2]|uniref:Uncharacterized protein n=1 Tax=Streptomyces macrolidinus TaxID=2952607 RepID=A0ABT0ZE76_9ACTN|nr:hypothetical protein [Streptomyces macrolidinus]MCN9241886.1 hypothetical protein [Streptomyces macrolidinus]
MPADTASTLTDKQLAVQGVDLATRRERGLAVSRWLLSAAEDPVQACTDWREHGVALLAAGETFGAVRIPGELMRVAAKTGDDEDVDEFLLRVLRGGPVFRDRISDAYYALVSESTARRWNPQAWPGVACLGRDCYLGVPALDPGLWQGRSYWCVALNSPTKLCDPRLVWAVVQRARDYRRATDSDADAGRSCAT